ncbi:MAG: organic hydroperoxide resistance protein [Lysobacteraceae bacterium]|jgi:osmotically inducible protein OsmC|nr:organic hydroperoxide resistance protein [Xanthomonadaceae bacterium]MCZ8319376.1 organic hydroperoxide resistance protein [Silanimonas sp.]
MTLQHALYTAEATSTGGRDGKTVASDGRFELALSTPKELGGAGGPGTNPEQLFAAGYSACFIGAMKFVAQRDGFKIPADARITGKVGIGPIPNGFGIRVELVVSLPGVDRETAHTIVERAHVVCPYSNATRGNVEVTFTLA